ncbi:MAG: HAMP domain-containing sensor histidine kinase [Vicinamibacterales bacterium]
MLHEFLVSYRDAIITRTQKKLTDRPWPLASTSELEHGVPLFLTQLVEILRSEAADQPIVMTSIGHTASRHGAELIAMGFNISQVVHDYGDLCQAVTELAVELEIPITTEEFHTLNRCLDTAIAEAVTEHARITAQGRTSDEAERTGELAHDIRDYLSTAVFAYSALRRGAVAINGSTGAVLGRSLMSLQALVDSSLASIRLASAPQRRQPVTVDALLSDVALSAALQAEFRRVQFVLEPVDPALAVHADPQLLASAVMNLLNNAFKFTRPGGRVMLRALRHEQLVRIEVADECGGLPDSNGDLFQPFGDRRGHDRSGLGLGLSIARKAVRAHGGDIQVRNIPGYGCVFVADLPLFASDLPALAPSGSEVR